MPEGGASDGGPPPFTLPRRGGRVSVHARVHSPSIEAARELVTLILEGEPPTDFRLAYALDRMAAAWHAAPEGQRIYPGIDPPERDLAALRAFLEARFPDYGFYRAADLRVPGDSPQGIGDAIDDLLDLVLDLSAAVWLADQVDLDDGHWHLHLLHFHWGRHLRDLALYLHMRQHESE